MSRWVDPSFLIGLAVLVAIAFLIAGCATKPVEPPQVTVQGPVFARSDFDCGSRPVPPSGRDGAGANGGRVALRYENRLGTWGQHCSNQLNSVGNTLKAAGQVAH